MTLHELMLAFGKADRSNKKKNMPVYLMVKSPDGELLAYDLASFSLAEDCLWLNGERSTEDDTSPEAIRERWNLIEGGRGPKK